MHLALIAALSVVVMISEHAPIESADNGFRLTIASIACMALPPLVALSISQIITTSLRRKSTSVKKSLSRLALWKKFHLGLWLLNSFVVLYYFQWVQLVRFNWQMDQMILIDELIIFLPVLLPLILSWAAFYRADCSVIRCPSNSPKASLSDYLVNQIRHYLSILLIPILVMITLQDLAYSAFPGFMDSSRTWLLWGPALIILLALFPTLLRTAWKSEPLPTGSLRERLEKTARRTGIHIREIYIWRTNRQITNAAVTGFLPRFRYVFLTDDLLARFSEDQIEAIFYHELGHVRHRHLLLRLAALIAPLGIWTMFQIAAPTESFSYEILSNDLEIKIPMSASLLPLGGMIGYISLFLAWYSRILEHQADLWACNAIRNSAYELQPESASTDLMIETLEKLSSMSVLPREKGSWLHPSIARRVALLRYYAEHPSAQISYQRRLRLVGSILIGITAIFSAAWPWILS